MNIKAPDFETIKINIEQKFHNEYLKTITWMFSAYVPSVEE